MAELAEYLQQLLHATQLAPLEQPAALRRLFLLDPRTNTHLARLNGALLSANVAQLVELRGFYGGDWPAFESAVVLFVLLATELNPWLLLELFDLYSSYANDMAVAFGNSSRGQLVAGPLRDAVDVVLPMAAKADATLHFKENGTFPRQTFLAGLLLRIFNGVRSQLGGDNAETARKHVMVFVGVRLCRLYFRIESPLLCRNIFSNMNNAQLLFGAFAYNDQLQYRYYLARFYLLKDQLVDAYQHFSWCLARCPPVLDNPNVSRLWGHLLPVGLVLGKRPRWAEVHRAYYSAPAAVPAFFAVYQELSWAIEKGNLEAFSAAIERHYAYLKGSRMLVLMGKAHVVLLRNLIKRLWLAGGCQPKVDYDSIRAGLRASRGARSTLLQLGDDDQTAENVMITLIDQNLVKGKLFPRLRMVSLSKTGVFPPVPAINFVKYGHGIEGKLGPSDRWME